MTLFVNGSKRTEINLFGKLSLITDDIVGKLFDMNIERKDFIVDNLRFEVFNDGPYTPHNEIIFIVSEI